MLSGATSFARAKDCQARYTPTEKGITRRPNIEYSFTNFPVDIYSLVEC